MKLRLDDVLTIDGRRLVVRGFDPMGVPAPRVYLEDLATGERVTELLARLSDVQAPPFQRRTRERR